MAPVSPDVPLRSEATAREPGARAPWGTITRQQIVSAALSALDTTGFEQMTIRSLAGLLGVSPMALYRHIRDKDDLLDEVVDELLRRAWHPPGPEKDWKLWTEEAADALRSLLVAEPAALHVYLRRPVVSATAIARMDAMLEVLLSAGFDQACAHQAYAAVHTYTVGFAALEASRARSGRVGAGAPDGVAARLAAYTSPQQFREGLRYLLDGIDPRARPGSGPQGTGSGPTGALQHG